ncbi:hypothetical protein SEF58_08945 [Neomoorella humiferrea]|uniref:Uncharacterized protein n=1 Tax=Neomoorella humiferrea TaxID=676965 RepID=A0A2T0AP36_9FIRM|nr:hypothetical protein [Moorella humiferrea]PRR70723.1 hypothetical protein MOHU_18300 [Moorella humiferrea]
MVGEENRNLCNELRRLGYYEFQIKEIITSIAGAKKINQLSLEDQEKIKARLVEQINFASKCMKIRR